jgi:ribonuclease E
MVEVDSGQAGRPSETSEQAEAAPAATVSARQGAPSTEEAGRQPEQPTPPGVAPVRPQGGQRVAARPRIGDTRPAPALHPRGVSAAPDRVVPEGTEPGGGTGGVLAPPGAPEAGDEPASAPPHEGTQAPEPATAAKRSTRSRRRGGRERKGKSVGRYLVCIHVRAGVTQVAMLEGRTLVEHYVSRSADATTQIDGNVYRGRVQNVLPGMEAAFVDIGIPKNAVLYRGDVHYDREDVEQGSDSPAGAGRRIEELLRPGQTILCQVTKNPIGAKGARLTQEVSLPGRFAVLVPNSSAFGISKRLGDNERRRLRRIVDEVRPPGHGLIIRTAAEGASADELRRDVSGLLEQWKDIEAAAARGTEPALLYREPDLAVRILREELNNDYRGVLIDDAALYQQVRDYVATVSPELAERVEYYDTTVEPLPIFERWHVHEQLHKALDRKVWLPSGGSLIIERTEALTVIDVNTGKNVGKTNLEETVFRNNLEAADEVARQLRLRDIGGIIVIDFIDMEVRENRTKVAARLRDALSRDKTRTQVFDISELGLVEMTRKRISEGLIESLSTECEVCQGRGIVLDRSLL